MSEQPTAPASDRMPPLDLWAGFECTVARIGDGYVDQLAQSGHAGRAGDLDLLPDLGATAARYPILWERIAPDGLARADWSWADARLGRLRTLGVRPIVGLCHHGSGPRHTSLVAPSFADGLAQFAGAVAERYPWVDAYTPVNEPLTTARFSGLYGHWYPHGSDDRTFVRALLNQCRAIVLAMRAIRAVNPSAQLVQTEDLGKVCSTPALGYQAAFENERRWLSLDLLCGRLSPKHPLWRWLRAGGATEEELEWFGANPCPPDVVGVNHYLSGERFLDERLERYPRETHGGNGRQAYADVLAARVVVPDVAGLRVLLWEAWERYGRPLVVTEAHNGCTREEQLRWVLEVWEAAGDVRDAGADVRAVTAWSLLGAYDWDSLLTRRAGHYEPGVFDLRAPRPRPTALAALLRGLAAGRTPEHPVLATPGWWRRPERLWYPAVEVEAAVTTAPPARPRRRPAARPIAILGPNAALAEAVVRQCALRGLTHRRLCTLDPSQLMRPQVPDIPWAVVYAGHASRRDGGPPHAEAAVALATTCVEQGSAFLAWLPDALSAPGRRALPTDGGCDPSSDCTGERGPRGQRGQLCGALPSALVIRGGPILNPCDRHDPLAAALGRYRQGGPFVAAHDLVSPAFVPDAVDAALDLLIDGEHGAWRLGTADATPWATLVRRAATMAGLHRLQLGQRASLDDGAITADPGAVVVGALTSRTGEQTLPLAACDDALTRYMDAWIARNNRRRA